MKATLIDLWSRTVEYAQSDKFYHNGKGNDYSVRISRAVSNSSTGSRAVSILAKFIFGGGLVNDTLLSSGGGGDKYLSDVVKAAVDDVALNQGFWIHVPYRLEGVKLVPGDISVLNYDRCRFSKEDDAGNKGKVYYKDFEEKNSFGSAKSTAKWYYPFSRDQNVIIAQIKADSKAGTMEEKLQNYRGQVLYVNLTPRYLYARSKFEAVYNDCDTESRMSLYSNSATRDGFLGKLAVITTGLDEEISKQVESDLAVWLGPEGTAPIYHLDVVGDVDASKVLTIVNVPTQYDDNQFINTEKRLRSNILGAANSIPHGLVFPPDTLFGGGGRDFEQMQIYYTGQVLYEVGAVERAFKLLGFDIELIPLVKAVEEELTETT